LSDHLRSGTYLTVILHLPYAPIGKAAEFGKNSTLRFFVDV
jgi:hypothetical protein